MRLTTRRVPRSRRFGLRKKEKGATIVLVTLSMVALLGMAAVSIDFAVASSEKAAVQNAADQAALALATDCSLKKTANCTTGTATWYAQQNAGASTSVQTLKDGVTKSPVFADGKVTVRVTKNVEHTFARMLGDASSNVQAEATATWNTMPLVGTKLIPIGLPYCDWLAAQPASATSPGAMRTYLWARYNTTESSCPGVAPTTTGTVYGKRGSSSAYSSVGQAMYFTRSFFPGVNTNCDFSASLWDVYRDMLDDWSLITADTCMESKLAGVGPGSVIMMPIYAIEKRSIFWGAVTYPRRLVILGFAPFKVDKWVNYPFFYIIQPSFGSLSYTNHCDMKFNFATIGGGCSGVRGQFIRSAEGALFNGFTQYGSFYANTGSGLSGDAPDLGLSNVKLVK